MAEDDKTGCDDTNMDSTVFMAVIKAGGTKKEATSAAKTVYRRKSKKFTHRLFTAIQNNLIASTTAVMASLGGIIMSVFYMVIDKG